MSSTLGIGLLMRRNFRSHRQDSRFSVFDGLGVTIAEAWPCACRLALCGRVTLLCSRPVFAAHKKHCCTRSRDKTSQPQQVHRSSTSRLINRAGNLVSPLAQRGGGRAADSPSGTPAFAIPCQAHKYSPLPIATSPSSGLPYAPWAVLRQTVRGACEHRRRQVDAKLCSGRK